ncbi:MAG: hypothetical protein HXY40_15385 [Chloroflexi bacterium]|nr:hypothetical protein [Chloroflexota bacterium]
MRFLRSAWIMVLVTLGFLLTAELLARAFLWRPGPVIAAAPSAPAVVYGFSAGGYGDLQPNLRLVVPLYDIRPYYLQTNSAGLRNTEELNPDESVIRILAVGDSFTFGAYVHNQETWPSRLEDRLNVLLAPGAQVQVLNAGIPGYTLEDEIAYLRDKGLALQPDVVIVGFYTNDIFDHYPALRQRLSRAVILAQAAATQTASPLRQFLQDNVALYALFNQWRAGQQVEQAVEQVAPQVENFQQIYMDMTFLETQRSEYQTYWQVYAGRFAELVRLLQEHNIPLVLIAFPDVAQLGMPEVFGPIPQQFLAQLTSDAGIPYLDLLPVLRDGGDIEETYLMYYDARRSFDPNALEMTGRGYSGDGHPSAFGYLLAARALADFLLANQLVP